MSSLPNESLLPANELLALNEGFDGNDVKSVTAAAGFFSTTGRSAPKSGSSTFVKPNVGANGLVERPSSAKRARRCISTLLLSMIPAALAASSGRDAPMISALSLLVDTDDLRLCEDERESGGEGMDEEDG